MLVPHGAYYVAYSALRSMVLTSPVAGGSLESVLQMTHSKTLNVARDILRQLEPDLADRIDLQVRRLKALRELVDYRAPTSGLAQHESVAIDYVDIARLAFEVAQLQSELRERALERRSVPRAPIIMEHAWAACVHVIDQFEFQDEDDWYRVGYLGRKHGFPANLFHMISEGHVDDVMIAWGPDDSSEEKQFLPDDRTVQLFDLP